MIENPFERDPADEDVRRVLAVYAAARLDPSGTAADRIRCAVMSAARAQSAASRGASSARRRRVAAAALLAAALAVGVGGATLAAAPSSPLYGLRLWVENATLPAEANARADAQLALLQARLADAQQAAASGNGSAVSAALAAYRAEVADLLATAGGDEARLAKLEAALGTHLVALRTLSSHVPEQARDAIDNAIENSSRAVNKVHQARGRDPATSPEPGTTPKPGHSPAGGPPSEQPTQGD